MKAAWLRRSNCAHAAVIIRQSWTTASPVRALLAFFRVDADDEAGPRLLVATAWRRGMGCGAKGVMTLGQETDIAGEEMLNMQHLEASPDGRFVLLVETERSEWGVQQLTTYRISAQRLIELMRAEGERMDG
ncbi:hypothetical protein [Paraburkholderia dilworthii]|uniref:hypothetical protein n=1 Tax=Paraburkholderia dilworthii TaxID=948106 RepID=UPI00041AAFF9|nr:hypothetical protein [Paraburkholderia dilworthii]